MECLYVLNNVIRTEDGAVNITDENPVINLSLRNHIDKHENDFSHLLLA